MANVKDAKNNLSNIIHKDAKKSGHYDIKPILDTNSYINIIVGKRSNGKSYAVLGEILRDYMENGRTTVMLRRWVQDFITENTVNLFNSHVANGFIDMVSSGLWTDICYYCKAWYFCKYDENGKRTKDRKPFMYAMALRNAEQHKSGWNDPNCYNILFDEFLATSDKYLPDEWQYFKTYVSTIQREKPDDEFRIFFVGNTLNSRSPYFKNLGLKKVFNQEYGTIEVYKFGNINLAIELTSEMGKDSELHEGFFYAFGDKTSRMSTHGIWELDEYPCRTKEMDDINEENIAFRFFIIYDEESYEEGNGILQCEIVSDTKGPYVFVHQRTYKLKDSNWQDDLIYMFTPDLRPNVRDTFRDPRDKLDKAINKMFLCKQFRYQDNDTGAILEEYLKQFE